MGDLLFNIENIYGSDYIDWLTGDDNVNEIYGGAGNDRLEGDAGADTLWGGAGNDKLYGGDGDDDLMGGFDDDTLYGNDGNDEIEGDSGEDTLEGGAGVDIYVFGKYHGTDTIQDIAGDTMTLRFYTTYSFRDFVRASNNFDRVGNNLEIIIDRDNTDGITDKVTILNAYDSDPTTGTGFAAFTINIEYGNAGSYTAVMDDFWHTLT